MSFLSAERVRGEIFAAAGDLLQKKEAARRTFDAFPKGLKDQFTGLDPTRIEATIAVDRKDGRTKIFLPDKTTAFKWRDAFMNASWRKVVEPWIIENLTLTFDAAGNIPLSENKERWKKLPDSFTSLVQHFEMFVPMLLRCNDGKGKETKHVYRVVSSFGSGREAFNVTTSRRTGSQQPPWQGIADTLNHSFFRVDASLHNFYFLGTYIEAYQSQYIPMSDTVDQLARKLLSEQLVNTFGRVTMDVPSTGLLKISDNTPNAELLIERVAKRVECCGGPREDIIDGFRNEARTSSSGRGMVDLSDDRSVIRRAMGDGNGKWVKDGFFHP